MIVHKHLLLLPIFLLAINLLTISVKSDEEECGWRCANGSCIEMPSWVCDGEADCGDKSDERHCLESHECPEDQFACTETECIDKSGRCDGFTDCTNEKDELDCSETPTTTTRNPLKWTFKECKPAAAILQFVAHNNTFMCIQINTDEEILAPSKCYANFSTRHDSISSMFVNEKTMASVYTTRNFPNQIQSYQLKKGEGDNFPGKSQIIVRHGIARFEHIAHDHLTGNIYFADNGNGIGVCNLDNRCKILINLLQEKFRDFLLLPERGAMFWIQWDKHLGYGKTVQIASMDGTDQRQLIASPKIYSIALDPAKDVMYFAEEESVFKYDLATGKNETYANVKASKILYFNCQLFYIDRDHRTLHAFDKEDGEKEIGEGYTNLLLSLALVPQIKPVPIENPCKNMGCEEICILSEESPTKKLGASCVLGQKMPLPNPDKKIVDEISIGWIFVSILMIAAILTCAFGAILYFGVFPKLNRSLKVKPRYNVRNYGAGDMNILYDTKSESIST